MTLAFLAAALISGAVAPLPGQAEEERLVLAFYYSWFDSASWDGGKASGRPLSSYNSDDASVMARQIDEAQSAGIDVFVLNWWGKGNRTEANLSRLLDSAGQKGFRVAAVFDINSPFMHGAGSYTENLRHLLTIHATQPAYLRVQGKPVVFFYNVARQSVATWQAIRDQVDPERKAIWIAEGTDLKYQAVFDGHHLYSITWPNRMLPSQILPKWGDRVRQYNRDHGTAKLWIATVMPGYDDRGVRPQNGFARGRDDGAYYAECWQAALASRPDWVIVNSYNEWMEGTQIEPGQAYGRSYLDQTREWATQFKQAVWGAAAPPRSTAKAPRRAAPVSRTPALTPRPEAAHRFLLAGRPLALPY